MRALVLDSELRFEPQHRLAAPQAGEVLMRVLRAGICNTDLELARGYMNFRGVLGHDAPCTVFSLTPLRR